MSSPVIPARKYTAADRKRARELFLTRTPTAQIAAEIGCSTDRVLKWAEQGENKISWYTAREEAERSLLEDGFGKRKRLNSLSADQASDLVQRGLDHLAARDQPLTANELERVMNVQAMLQKELRLDSGKSTENVAVAATIKMSAEEVRKAILEDPFYLPPVADGTAAK